MSNTKNLSVVKRLFDACNWKEYERIRELVHVDYKLRDPLITLRGPDALIDMIKACPGGWAENPVFIAEGDKVVTLFDCVMKGRPTLRMCSVMTVVDGKVREEEMFYDTAKTAREMKDAMKTGKTPPPPVPGAHLEIPL